MPNKEDHSRLLSVGRWDKNLSWEFFVSSTMPPLTLCTAVCCVPVFHGFLALVRNKRGWELPAGKIEPKDETVEAATRRELKEEIRAEVGTLHFFGYKKITAQEPVVRPGHQTGYYPFPNSYVVFSYAEILNFRDTPTAPDVQNTQLLAVNDAQQVLAENGQYPGILEYLLLKQVLAR